VKPGPRLIGPLYRAVDPKTLVGVKHTGEPGQTFRLTAATADAFRKLRDAGLAAGHKIWISSGYRSPEHQTKLFSRSVLKYGSEAAARKWVAKFSEHATGQTVDFDLGIPNSSENARSGAFQRLPAWQWLSVAAPDHGWTPYPAEPWHWTFNPIP
jgi:LAS superfamily LD-carboxypeptidase LdcB